MLSKQIGVFFMKNKLIEKFSETYGNVNYEFVGNIDYSFLAMYLPFEEFQKWSKKYHPLNYFSACYWENAKETELGQKLKELGHEPENINLFVCIDDINNDWDQTHWISQYPALGKRKRKLPISTTRKKIEKWKEELEKIYKIAEQNKLEKNTK